MFLLFLVRNNEKQTNKYMNKYALKKTQVSGELFLLNEAQTILAFSLFYISKHEEPS